MLIPTTGNKVGLTSATIGLYYAFKQRNVPVHLFKFYTYIKQGNDGQKEKNSYDLMCELSDVPIIEPIFSNVINDLVAEDKVDDLLELIVAKFQQNMQNYYDATGKKHITIVEGLAETSTQPYAKRLNRRVAQALSCDIIFITCPFGMDQESFVDHIQFITTNYTGDQAKKLLGIIAMHLQAPLDKHNQILSVGEPYEIRGHIMAKDDFANHAFFTKIPILGAVPFNQEYILPRMQDLCNYLDDITIVHQGNITTKRIKHMVVIACTINNIERFLQPDSVIFTPSDRIDIITGIALYVATGLDVSGIILTGGYAIDEKSIRKSIEVLKKANIPIITTKATSSYLSRLIADFGRQKPYADNERIHKICEHVANHLDDQWIESYSKHLDTTQKFLSPAAFRYQLIQKASQLQKRIVLPEGNEPRTIKAANICMKKNIAKCVLIGNTDDIQEVAKTHNINLHQNIEIIDPRTIIDTYVDLLVESRSHKGMTSIMAKEELEDHVFLATMMLKAGDVDGLVSGAVNTTANTIRPALQVIKTAKNASLVSSIFFMCLPNQVVVYGDCAINPDPNYEQLADIAIQSADSAKAMGIKPLVAMISYSTGNSGKGDDVEKVKKATALIKEKRPDIIVDGPLQYDAASTELVAKSKAPNSLVAGKATVFVFSDLNTGNTTYKAVQRSANVISIGPMLQGMAKPVNDLSRGALVDDIVYTIALSAIQAGQLDAYQ